MFDSSTTLNLIIDDTKLAVTFTPEDDRLILTYRFNKSMNVEIKKMDGYKWHGYDDPPRKVWSIKNSPRNHFLIKFLAGLDPYAPYDQPVKNVKVKRKLYLHQRNIVAEIVTYKRLIVAAEMGTGKTLAAIEAIEHTDCKNIWWVSPKAALNSTRLELSKWGAKFIPELHTYDSLKKRLEGWREGTPPPQFVVFDEASRIKTPTAQRSEAARHLANSMRTFWGDKCYIVLMSGSPAPKNPGDWWHLCEVACPGYIAESTLAKFIDRLAIIEEQDNGGGFYKKIVAWKDNSNKCNVCGKLNTDVDHDVMTMVTNPHAHAFIPTTNEVEFLHKRMKGLVYTYLKKDCLDLPDKQYRLIKLRPSLEMANMAKLITKTAIGATDKLIRLRELSDGFQYNETPGEKETCTTCKGSKIVKESDGEFSTDYDCMTCGGKGYIVPMVRTVQQLETAKDEALIDILDEHEDGGRLVVFAAFTASIDRVVKICQLQKWDVIRIDGRGWAYFGDQKLSDLEMLKHFQKEVPDYATKIVVVAHPKSGGMGLTLTASPSSLYYSNDFDAEGRIQSEDRIHRPGMDLNRGATIIDLVNLPTDKLILDNLKLKRNLQAITLGEITEALDNIN